MYGQGGSAEASSRCRPASVQVGPLERDRHEVAKCRHEPERDQDCARDERQRVNEAHQARFRDETEVNGRIQQPGDDQVLQASERERRAGRHHEHAKGVHHEDRDMGVLQVGAEFPGRSSCVVSRRCHQLLRFGAALAASARSLRSALP